eukprot:6102877-Prymnesium_polylepis.2
MIYSVDSEVYYSFVTARGADAESRAKKLNNAGAKPSCGRAHQQCAEWWRRFERMSRATEASKVLGVRCCACNFGMA